MVLEDASMQLHGTYGPLMGIITVTNSGLQVWVWCIKQKLIDYHA